VGSDKIIYGEPWIDSSDPRYEANPDWNWYKADAPITFFQDDTRNALCGGPWAPHNPRTDRGYAGGNGNRAAARAAIANAFADERDLNAGINYLDIHDNWALADRFALRDWDGLAGVDEARVRIAAAMLMTSLGPVVMHGGTEFLRSKAAAGDHDTVMRIASGPVYIHGKGDTYNLRTPNLFLWENLGRNMEDGAVCNFQRMYEYWRGLIALRRGDHGRVLRIGSLPSPDHVVFIEPADTMQLGYIIGSRICVLVNTADTPAVVELPLPAGEWTLVADGDRAGVAPLEGRPDTRLAGSRTHTIHLPPTSVKIWLHH
jgi:pullulanase